MHRNVTLARAAGSSAAALRKSLFVALVLLASGCGPGKGGTTGGTNSADGGLDSKPKFSAVITDHSVGISPAHAQGLSVDGNVGEPLASQFSAPPFEVQPGIIPQSDDEGSH